MKKITAYPLALLTIFCHTANTQRGHSTANAAKEYIISFDCY
ncbi:hypothetical protein FLA_1926 [Filimonas lacunae]|nr:hypothetical protein FLA_1926 [Filimonas lacunae]